MPEKQPAPDWNLSERDAIILQELARHFNGDSDDPLYPEMRTQGPPLAARTLAFVEGETDRP